MMDIVEAIVSGQAVMRPGIHPLNVGEIEAIYAQMLADGTSIYPGKLFPPLLTIEEWRDRELAKATA